MIDKQHIGFATAFFKTDGSTGYIDIDSHSGGYPYFSSSIPWTHLHKSPASCLKEIKMALREMRTYFGSSDVKWDSFFVAEIIIQRADDVFVDELIQQELLDKVKKTFTEDELAVLKELWVDK